MSPVATLPLLSHWGTALCLTWTLRQPPRPSSQSSAISSGGWGVGVPARGVGLLHSEIHGHFCGAVSSSGASVAGELPAGAGAQPVSVLWHNVAGHIHHCKPWKQLMTPVDCWMTSGRKQFLRFNSVTATLSEQSHRHVINRYKKKSAMDQDCRMLFKSGNIFWS